MVCPFSASSSSPVRGLTACCYGPPAMRLRSFAARLTVIVLLAFAGRCAYVLAVTQHQPDPDMTSPRTGTVRSFDELYYQNGAERLSRGEGFKNPLLGPPDQEAAYHPPMPSLVLAPVAWLTDGSALAMRLTMALAGAGVVAVIGLIGREAAGTRAGLVAAGTAAVYPNLWMNDGILLSETLATLGVAGTVLFAYRLLRRGSWVDGAAAGVWCGVGMLSRPESALLLPLLLIPVALRVQPRDAKRRLLLCGVAIAATVITVAPWSAYNLSRFDKPVLISYGDGDSLIGANCRNSYRGPLFGLHDGTCGLGQGDSPEPSVKAAEKRSIGLRYMRGHLDRVPVVMAARVGRMWGVYRPFQMISLAQTEGRPRWASTTGWAMSFGLVGAAVFGARALRQTRRSLIPLLAPLVVVTLTAASFFGLMRFRAPAEPSIVVLAAVGVEALLVARTARRARAPSLTPSSCRA